MPVYSYSRIGCFENCPRQFKFRYIEKPDIDKPQGVEAFMGTIVHETLEACYRLAGRDKPLKIDELLALYKRLWDDKLPDNLKIVREEMTAKDYFNLGKKSLQMYHARYYPFDQELTIGLERRISLNLDPDGKYKMTGIIDRLSRDGSGRLRIHDYKTSANLPTQQEMDADNQLALYQTAVDEMWPDNNGIELVWHYTQFDTTLTSHRDSSQLKELRKIYIGKIREIESAIEHGNFETKESSLCDWCEYHELCPAKGGSGVQPIGQQQLKSIPEKDQKSLVDEYVALDKNKKDLESRLNEIKEQLIQCGEVGSSKLLTGTGDWHVMVTLSRVAKLPSKTADEKAHDDIRRMVEKAGLYSQYSSLDVRGLQKALTKGRLSPELTGELKRYQELSVQSVVRVKKLGKM